MIGRGLRNSPLSLGAGREGESGNASKIKTNIPGGGSLNHQTMEFSPREGKTGRQLETKYFWHRSNNYRVGFGFFFSPQDQQLLL